MTEALLSALQRQANNRGLVLARSEALEAALECSASSLEHSLGLLEGSGKIRILSPLPFLTIALLPRPLSGSRSLRVKKVQQSRSSERSLQEEVPVSSAAATATQQREVGGAGEGEALLDAVLTVLGPEADRDEFAHILAGQSVERVRRCLRRVQATRAIRVSKAALFRSLLSRL